MGQINMMVKIVKIQISYSYNPRNARRAKFDTWQDIKTLNMLAGGQQY